MRRPCGSCDSPRLHVLQNLFLPDDIYDFASGSASHGVAGICTTLHTRQLACSVARDGRRTHHRARLQLVGNILPANNTAKGEAIREALRRSISLLIPRRAGALPSRCT